jgi:alpha-1,2-mannosyltransferase
LPKDFAQYYVAGKLALRGRLDALYFADLRTGLTQSTFPNSEFARTGREFGIAETSYFLYPPWVAWLYAPLALLPPWPAFVAARFLAWLALVGGFLVVAGAVPAWGPEAALATFALFAFSPPVRAALSTAQASVPLFLLLALFAGALARGRERVAGAWWGAMAALKLFPLMFALWLVAMRRGRALLTGAVCGLALLLVGIAAGGWTATARFLGLLREHLPYSTPYAPNQSLTGFALRWSSGANPFDWSIVPVPPAIAWGVRGLQVALLVVTLVLVVRARSRGHAWNEPLGLSLFTVWALLVAPDAWLHHLVALALPAAVAAARLLATARGRTRSLVLWVGFGALLFGYDAYERVAGPGAGSLLRTALASTPLAGALVLWALLALQMRDLKASPAG